MDDLTRRAFVAYFRTGGTDQPSNTSGEVDHDGRRYVVLHNNGGVLAVYRVFTKAGVDTLRKMHRWPAALDGSAEAKVVPLRVK